MDQSKTEHTMPTWHILDGAMPCLKTFAHATWLSLTSFLFLGALNLTWGDELSSKSATHIDKTVHAFMTSFDVPGLSIAVAKDGRLVLAKGFGHADTSAMTPVTSASRFRIASVSKPITSIAIHRLVELGKLDLDDRVFGKGAIFGESYGSKKLGPDVRSITVRQLMEHAHGGWDNKSRDPMFQKPSYDHSRLIDWTLDTRKLDRQPGAGYSYSNFGYCLLGRIIEKIAGVSYEQFVREQILRPAGVTSMEIGGDELKDRKPKEVVYYGQNSENPYGMKVARMDSHGGWIATPSDLVRIAVRADGFATKPDILSAESIASMTRPSKNNPGYAKGWSVNRSKNWWHGGSLPGSKSIFVRTHHGFCWAVLTNTRSRKSGYGAALDRLTWDILKGVPDWPKHDLFSE